MTPSHAAGRASEPPTFAQLKDLMSQIESGRVTKDRFQAFLRGSDQGDWFTFDNPGRSLIQMRDANPSLVWESTWYEGQDFAGIYPPEKTQIQFQIPVSGYKSAEDQAKLLAPGESFPTPQQAVAGLLDYYERFHRFPLEEGIWIRTSSVTSASDHVGVGVDQGRVYVGYWDGVGRLDVFAARVRNS